MHTKEYQFSRSIFKSTFLLLTLCVISLSCNFKKTTLISIENQNDYAIDFIVRANNVSTEILEVAPHKKIKKDLIWNTISKEDGQWVLIVRNSQSQQIDSFSHGYFMKGELCNFLDAISMGDQLKVNLSN
ncbi:MAG: hypothetical protein R2831_12315 [Chitinophagaceae bacterium]